MSAFRLALSLSSLMSLLPLTAQAPQATVYGTGCHGLELGSTAPVVGGQWQLTTIGVPAVSPFAIEFIGDVPLPAGVPLPTLGLAAPACSAYVGNVLSSLTVPAQGGVATASIAIPPDPQLAGTQLSVQSLSLTTANPSWVATSNGLTGTIGDNPGYTDFQFNNRTVIVQYGNMQPQVVVLDGLVGFSQNGMANGTLTATFADGSDAILQYSGNNVVILSGGTLLDLWVNGATSQIIVNGSPNPVGNVLGTMRNDLLQGGGPGNWNPSSAALLGLAAVAETVEMQNNFLAAGVAAAAAPGWFCKAGATTFATAASMLAFAGCNAIAVACGASATITVGGSTIACAPLLTACYGGLLATPALAYVWYIDNVWS